MRTFTTPTVLVSSCLAGKACRYDGSCAVNDIIKKLRRHTKLIEVCPETAIHLPIPRQALRIISEKEGDKRLVFSQSGEDLTDQMKGFAESFVSALNGLELHGVILKGRSPSCGLKDVKVYRSYGKAPSLPKKTSGFFAERLMEEFAQVVIEDEGRLMNYNIREQFFTRIFTLAAFQKVKEGRIPKALLRFHSENKYLFMAYSPAGLKKLDELTANYQDQEIVDLFEEYEVLLNKALSVMPTHMRNVNMLLHLLGYFRDQLSNHEKAFFLDSLEGYRSKQVPFSVPLAIIHAWVVRFENEYLLNQTLFEAFPPDLVEVTDSGKGI